MKLLCLVTAMVFGAVAAPVYADPDKDESGQGRKKHERRAHKGGDYKEEYWDGNCKVERKWERNGKYKEERKCEGPSRHSRGHGHPPAGQAGVVIQPPAVVIHPPSVIIK